MRARGARRAASVDRRAAGRCRDVERHRELTVPFGATAARRRRQRDRRRRLGRTEHAHVRGQRRAGTELRGERDVARPAAVAVSATFAWSAPSGTVTLATGDDAATRRSTSTVTSVSPCAGPESVTVSRCRRERRARSTAPTRTYVSAGPNAASAGGPDARSPRSRGSSFEPTWRSARMPVTAVNAAPTGRRCGVHDTGSRRRSARRAPRGQRELAEHRVDALTVCAAPSATSTLSSCAARVPPVLTSA